LPAVPDAAAERAATARVSRAGPDCPRLTADCARREEVALSVRAWRGTFALQRPYPFRQLSLLPVQHEYGRADDTDVRGCRGACCRVRAGLAGLLDRGFQRVVDAGLPAFAGRAVVSKNL